MNRQAVALAADSATTVEYWTGKKYENRYFKGANKIFHLSHAHPVGLMIYGTADLQSVSWEVVAKSFRDHMAGKSEPTVARYAEEFFKFIETSPLIFPTEYQKKWFLEKASRAALLVLISLTNNDKFKNAKKSADKKKIAEASTDSDLKLLKKGPFVPGTDQQMIDDAISAHLAEVSEGISSAQWFEEYGKFFDPDKIAEAAILGVYYENMPGLDNTGLVFAGFGDDEYFPSAEVFECHGLILGKCLRGPKGGKLNVNPDSGSFIEPMAKSDMIQTFVDGVGLGALSEIDSELVRALDSFAAICMKENNIKKWDELDAKKEEVRNQFREAVFDYMFENHTIPMRRVVGMLPLDDLADLAETLIYMESLKERVTTPSESVSGPIDVAVISKNDGFIWMKRKHYFDPSLNPRYFASNGFVSKT